VSNDLPRLKENDGIVAPSTAQSPSPGKALRHFTRLWDALCRAIEARLEVLGQGIVAALGDGTGVGRTITGGPGISVADGDGIAGNPTIYRLGPDNFGFNIGGLMTAGEYLGSAVYDDDVLFPSVLKPPVVVSEFPATASAVFNIKSRTGAVETQRGTITFAAGGTTGTVAWSGVYTLPAGDRIKLYGPTPKDTTLSMITGLVPGDLS
jgi:hypothetical protein